VIVVNENQELEAAEAEDSESTEIDHSVLGGLGVIDQAERWSKMRSVFQSEGSWDFTVVSVAEDEWRITVTNSGTHFATFAVLGIKLRHELKGAVLSTSSLRALGSTTLNPGESVDLALHVVFRDPESDERIESSGRSDLTVSYLAWTPYTANHAKLNL